MRARYTTNLGLYEFASYRLVYKSPSSNNNCINECQIHDLDVFGVITLSNRLYFEFIQFV